MWLQMNASISRYQPLHFFPNHTMGARGRGSSETKPILSFRPLNTLYLLQASPPNTRPSVPRFGEGEGRQGDDEELRFVRGKKLLRDLSTWGIGGPCNYYIQVFSEAQLLSAIRHCYRHFIQFLVIGKGSKCLFDDLGFNGCIILNKIESFERIGPGTYRVGGGYPFNKLGIQCSNEGFSGLEFASGIPGTVGGAAFMNTGANGQEIADAIESVSIFMMDGRHRVLRRSDLAFGYRWSCFQEMEDLAAITAVTFQLTPSAWAMKRQRAYFDRRRKSQPLQERTAGSVFRNPSPLVSAAELIEQTGLKGFTVGGAKVSDLHANFFINYDMATSTDMLQLIDSVKEKVYQRFSIKLEEEIRYIPYDSRLSAHASDSVDFSQDSNMSTL